MISPKSRIAINIVDYIDETIKTLDQTGWETIGYEGIDDIVESTITNVERILRIDDAQLDDIGHFTSMAKGEFKLPCIYIDAYPSLDSPTEFVINCDPRFNGGNGSIHLPTDMSDGCLNALSSGRRDYLHSLATKIAEDGLLTQNEEDEISYGDYAVRIFFGGRPEEVKFVAFTYMR